MIRWDKPALVEGYFQHQKDIIYEKKRAIWVCLELLKLPERTLIAFLNGFQSEIYGFYLGYGYGAGLSEPLG